MNESQPKFESNNSPEITRELAINAYNKFVENGIASPDNLDSDDPKVIEANRLFDEWVASIDQKSEGDVDAEQRANFEKTMFYVDAGFTDPAYLEEVLGWLMADGVDVEKDTDEENKMKLRKDIADAMNNIRSILKGNK